MRNRAAHFRIRRLRSFMVEIDGALPSGGARSRRREIAGQNRVGDQENSAEWIASNMAAKSARPWIASKLRRRSSIFH